MPQVSAAVLRSTPSSTSASASIRRAAALSFSPLAALRSSEPVLSSRVFDTAAPIDAAPLKDQRRVRVSLIWESLMSHSFGPLVSRICRASPRDGLLRGRRLSFQRESQYAPSPACGGGLGRGLSPRTPTLDAGAPAKLAQSDR